MKEKRENLIGGLILVSIGVLALLPQFVDFSGFENLAIYIVAALGAFFLLLGITSHEAGWIIPGGILSGIGTGIVLISGSNSPFSGDVEGGVFMLSFAAGWGLITILTALFTEETHWWALIPGGIMALIGTAVIWGSPFMNILEIASKAWPLILIAAGIYILYKANCRDGKEEKEIEDLIKQID